MVNIIIVSLIVILIAVLITLFLFYRGFKNISKVLKEQKKKREEEEKRLSENEKVRKILLTKIAQSYSGKSNIFDTLSLGVVMNIIQGIVAIGIVIGVGILVFSSFKGVSQSYTSTTNSTTAIAEQLESVSNFMPFMFFLIIGVTIFLVFRMIVNSNVM